MKNIKWMWNGIKVDGKLCRAWYSKGVLVGDTEESFTIYARGHSDRLPQGIGLQVQNDSDGMTDYFETDRARVRRDSPLWNAVSSAYEKQQIHNKAMFEKKMANREARKIAKAEASAKANAEAAARFNNNKTATLLKEIDAIAEPMTSIVGTVHKSLVATGHGMNTCGEFQEIVNSRQALLEAAQLGLRIAKYYANLKDNDEAVLQIEAAIRQAGGK